MIVGQLLLLAHESGLDGLGQNLVPIESPSVVLDGDADAAAFVEGVQTDRAQLGLVAGEAFIRRFQSMIGGISHEVRERIADGLDDGFIQLGFLAGEDELNLLPRFPREISDQPGKPAEGAADGQHTDAHDPFLNFPRVPFELRDPFQQHRQLRHLEAHTQVAEHRLGNDQFADEVDQFVDLGGIHADRRSVGALFGMGRAFGLFLQGLGNLLRCGGMLLDQDLADPLLLRQRMVQRLARDDSGFDKNFAKRFGLIAGSFLFRV